MALRSYSGAAVATTIGSTITSTSLTITLGASTGWPTGSGGKFYIVIDRGLASEEKILATSRSGVTLTIASTGDRGLDSTTAQAHSAGAAIEHAIASPDVAEPNVFINTPGTTSDISASAPSDTVLAGTTGRFADAGHRHAREAGPAVATFVVYHSANQTLTTGTSTVLSMNSELVDTHSGHSTSSNTSRYTIPAGWAGTWFFSGQIEYVANATGSRYARVMVNGTTTKLTNSRSGIATDVADVNVSGLIPGLVAGDYVELVGLQTSGGDLASANQSTITPLFSGFWVHA